MSDVPFLRSKQFFKSMDAAWKHFESGQPISTMSLPMAESVLREAIVLSLARRPGTRAKFEKAVKAYINEQGIV